VRRGSLAQREDAVHPGGDAALLEELEEGPHGLVDEREFPRASRKRILAERPDDRDLEAQAAFGKAKRVSGLADEGCESER
jgi:hypothetical protein